MRMSRVKFATCSEVGIVTGYPGVFLANPHPYPRKPVTCVTGTGLKMKVENRNNTPAILSGFQTDNAMDYWLSNPDFLGLCSGFTVSHTLSAGRAGPGQGHFCRPVPWPSGHGPANLTRARGQLGPGHVGSGRAGPGSTLALDQKKRKKKIKKCI